MYVSRALHNGWSTQYKKNRVMEHERRNGIRYDYFIRSRPDYIVWNPEPMQPKLTQMLAVRPKPDMLFTIPRAKLHEWLTGINETECLNVVRRPEHCCLEYTHGMLKPTNHRTWRQQGALARGWEHMEYASVERPHIPRSLLHCNRCYFGCTATIHGLLRIVRRCGI